jgi:hypothetical protein
VSKRYEELNADRPGWFSQSPPNVVTAMLDIRRHLYKLLGTIREQSVCFLVLRQPSWLLPLAEKFN